MVKRILFVLFLAASASAIAGMKDKLPLEAYIDPIDRQIAETGKGLPGRPAPCARAMVSPNGQRYTMGIPTDQCVKMQPARRWRGLWRNDFEGSQFCEAPAKECTFRDSAERVWLTERPNRRGDGKLYEIEFVGRRTMYRGPYGHGPVFDHEIIMDRMISKKLIEEKK